MKLHKITALGYFAFGLYFLLTVIHQILTQGFDSYTSTELILGSFFSVVLPFFMCIMMFYKSKVGHILHTLLVLLLFVSCFSGVLYFWNLTLPNETLVPIYYHYQNWAAHILMLVPALSMSGLFFLALSRPMLREFYPTRHIGVRLFYPLSIFILSVLPIIICVILWLLYAHISFAYNSSVIYKPEVVATIGIIATLSSLLSGITFLIRRNSGRFFLLGGYILTSIFVAIFVIPTVGSTENLGSIEMISFLIPILFFLGMLTVFIYNEDIKNFYNSNQQDKLNSYDSDILDSNVF